jgi:hypothetical protein
MQVSIIRSRDRVLSLLLPKFVGLLWDKGLAVNGKAKTVIDQGIELNAHIFRPNGFMLSVYAETPSSPSDKVFSAHLAPDPHSVEPSNFPYQGGRCGVLSWKRGRWEDIIVNAAVEAKEIERLLTINPEPKTAG